MTEEERIRRVAGGDKAAFGPLVEAYQGLVYSYLRRQGMDVDPAHDVLQETFTKAMGSLASLREPGAFKAWLLRIAHSELLKYLRKQKETAVDFSAEESKALLAKASEALEGNDPAEIAGRHLEAARVLQRMEKLPQIYRQTLFLRYQGGLPYKDVARVLGITVENAKFRVHHGLKLLRALCLS